MPALGRWEALITIPSGGSAVSATNGAGGPSTVTVPAGSYYYTAVDQYASLITTLQTQLNASRPAGWTVTISTGASGTGRVTINCSSTPWSITWTSTELRDALGFTANIAAVSAAQTGAKQARGLWFPDCPLDLEGHPSMAPPASDLTTVTTPRGEKFGFVANRWYRHRRLVYSHVPEARYREEAAALDNASWERFIRDVQLGDGLSFFTVPTPVQIYWDRSGTETALGIDGNGAVGVRGWHFEKAGVEERRAAPGVWAGLWTIAVDEVTAIRET